MDMKIKAHRIKVLRKERLWSQEELSVASGLGLRTIQRAESSGAASMETVKALSAAFEVNAQELLKQPTHCIPYFNIQLSYVCISLSIILVAFAAFQLQRGAMDIISFAFFLTLSAIIVILFPTLTVKVNSDNISWYFGFGFWKKIVPVRDVIKAEVVRNRMWYGFGIRYFGSGWLYNVSGLDAVELLLPENKRIRIGTDEPERLFAAISEAISK